MLCLLTQSCLSLCNPMGCSLPGSSVHVESPSKNIRVDCHALFQEIFPTQGSNPGLPHCMWIVYRLNHQGSPRILEKVAYLFSRETLRPHISCLPYTSWRQLLAKKVFTHLSFIFLAKHFIPHPILVNAAPSPCLAHADSFNVSVPISTKIYGSLSDMRDRRKNKVLTMSQSSSSHLLCLMRSFLCLLHLQSFPPTPRSLTTVAHPELEAKLRGFLPCTPSFEFLKSPPALQRFPAIQTTHMVSFIYGTFPLAVCRILWLLLLSNFCLFLFSKAGK